jgi:hypothetical protein
LESAAGALGLSYALSAVGMTAIGLMEVRQAIRAIAEGLKEARDYAKETARENIKLYDALREIAFLKGEQAPTAMTAAEQLQLGMESGLTPEELKPYTTHFKSAFFAVRNKGNLQPAAGTTAEQLERQAEVVGAQFAAAKGVAPEAAANMVAAIGQGRPIRRKEDLQAELNLSLQNLAEGKGELSDLIDQTLRARGTMIGAGWAGNVADVTAQISALSLNNPAGRTATRLESIVNMVTKATTNKKFAPKLAKLGITPQNRDLADILRRLAPVIAEAEKPGGAGGLATLRELGMADSRGMMELFKAGQERTLLEGQLRRNAAGLGSREAVEEQAALFQQRMGHFRQSKPGAMRFEQANVAAADFLRGLPGEQMAIERQGALAQLTTDRRIKTPTAAVMKAIGEQDIGGRLATLGGKSYDEQVVDREVARRLLAQARAKGLSEAEIRKLAPDVHGVAADRMEWATPSLLGAIANPVAGVSAFLGQGARSMARGFVGEDTLGTQVQALRDAINGNTGVPGSQAALRSIQGKLSAEEQLGMIVDEQKRADAQAHAPGVKAAPAPEVKQLVDALNQNNQLLRENNRRMGPPPPVAARAPAALPAAP